MRSDKHSFDDLIQKQILEGMTSRIIPARQLPYSMTDLATADYTIIFSSYMKRLGFESAQWEMGLLDKNLKYLSKYPSNGTDASRFAYGLKYYQFNKNCGVYFIPQVGESILIIRILNPCKMFITNNTDGK